MRKRALHWQASRLVHSPLTIKFVSRASGAVWRWEVGRRRLRVAMLLALTVVTAIATVSIVWANRSAQSFSTLQAATVQQQSQLRALDLQAGAIDRQLREIQAQNQALRGLIGTPEKRRAAAPPEHAAAGVPLQLSSLQSHFASLRTDAARAAREHARLSSLALRVLNMRHLESLSRARVLAGIPSIRPVAYEVVASTFGWRTNPWPEFHQGLDLDAEVGTPVRSTAAGTVTFAGWDGGYGQKVEVDHHNGFATWYCHLSRIDVQVGDPVGKGRVIAAVGATGEATGPHLHYQVMKAGRPIDPMPFMDGIPAGEIASLK